MAEVGIAVDYMKEPLVAWKIISGPKVLELTGGGKVLTCMDEHLRLGADVRGWKEHEGEWIVDTVLTGNFKASPARFEYFISLMGDKISKLRVEFRGSQKQ
jgi:hypothetical protein